MKNYKVWGGLTMQKGTQIRTVIATKTKKKAVELLNFSYNYFNDYWCETGNKNEIKLALSMPETIIYVKEI